MSMVPQCSQLSKRTTVIQVVAALAVGLTWTVPSLDAQVQRQPRRGERTSAPRQPHADRGVWQLERNAAVDLWFHGLAVIGVEGSGLLPLYSEAYASRVREEKERLGVYPTKLDDAGAGIKQAIEGDGTLSLLHFAPLYFYPAGPLDMLRALDAVADGRARNALRSGRDVRFGALVMAQALQTASQRRVMRRLVEALEEEYAVFFAGFWERGGNAATDQLLELNRRWTYGLALDLDRFLARAGLGSGILIPSPALGPEGRLQQANPAGGQPQLIAVWMPVDGGADAPLYGIVKEIAFAVVDRVIDPERYDASELEEVRARAAVRSGAILLEFYSPAQLSGYRRAFLEAAGGAWTGRGTAAAFEKQYPLDPDVLAMLRREVRRR